MSKNPSWDSVENSRKSRLDENVYIANLAASLPFCYKARPSNNDGDNRSSRFIGIDGPKKLPTLRYAVSYALKETLLMNALGIVKNGDSLLSENTANEHLSSIRSDHEDLLIVFDPSNFYLERGHEKPIGRRRSSTAKVDQDVAGVAEHGVAESLLESGKIIFISENCERFFGLAAVAILAKYESVYELMSTSEAEKLASLIDCMMAAAEDTPAISLLDEICLCSFADPIVSEGKFSLNALSMPVLSTLRLLKSKDDLGKGVCLEKSLVAMRCRSLTSFGTSSFSFKCSSQDLTIQQVFGGNEAIAELRGENWLTVIHPDYLEHTLKQLKVLLEKKSPVTVMTRLITKHKCSANNKKTVPVQAVLTWNSDENLVAINCQPLPEDNVILSELLKLGDLFAAKENPGRTGNEQQPLNEPLSPSKRDHQRLIQRTSVHGDAKRQRSSVSVPVSADNSNSEYYPAINYHSELLSSFITATTPSPYVNLQQTSSSNINISEESYHLPQAPYPNSFVAYSFACPDVNSSFENNCHYQQTSPPEATDFSTPFIPHSTTALHSSTDQQFDYCNQTSTVNSGVNLFDVNRINNNNDNNNYNVQEWQTSNYRPSSPNSSSLLLPDMPTPVSLAQAVPESSYSLNNSGSSFIGNNSNEPYIAQDSQNNKIYARL